MHPAPEMMSAEQVLVKTLFRSLLVLSITILSACGNRHAPSTLLVLGGQTMGTTYTIKINQDSLAVSEQQLDQEIGEILEDINLKMSTYLPESELSRLNTEAGEKWLPVSGELYEILAQALELSNLTAGYFDITVGPLVNLWGFGPEKVREELPSIDEIKHLLNFSGSRKLELRAEPAAIRKSAKGIYMDLSAIAKGHAVDRIANYLESEKINSYMVEVGGEIRARGVNDIGFAWRVGIEQPSTATREVQRVIKLEDIAMATSGDYRNFYEIDGKKYSHTIDPLSGWPVEHELASVTVLHPSASRADALATGFLAMGKDKAWKIAIDEKLAVFFIERKDKAFVESYTPAMTAYLLLE